MRLRFAVLASVLTALVAVPVSSVTAAPKPHRTLTINATPNPVIAGQSIFVYGQLSGGNVSGQTIRLYSRIPATPGVHLVATTTTNSFGFYEFNGPGGALYTNRVLFVRGPSVRSPSLRERVSALVSLSASATSADTRHPIVFSGHVTPNHAGEPILLQEQGLKSEVWHTVKRDVIGPGSNYSITYRFVIPGERMVRALLPGDVRNIRSASDSIDVTIQQTQVPGFTITTSDPIIPEGGSAIISGVLDKKASTAPEPSTSVTLWAKTHDQLHYSPVASMNTASDGSYKFTVHPTVNELYQVRTTFKPARHTAVLFEGVHDVVTMTASTSTSQVGGKVTFQGVVTPDKAGHVIYLQQQGSDGDWHNVEKSIVRFNSTYQFIWRFGEAGAQHFRSWIPHDEFNIGGVSPPVTVNVMGVVTTVP